MKQTCKESYGHAADSPLMHLPGTLELILLGLPVVCLGLTGTYPVR